MPTRCTIAGRAMTSSMSGATAGIATPMAGGCCRTYFAGSGRAHRTRAIPAAPAHIHGFDTEALLADKAYDSNALRALIADAGAQAVIPSNRSRKIIIPHDPAIYKHRNRIERCFNKLKHFRRFATRYD